MLGQTLNGAPEGAPLSVCLLSKNDFTFFVHTGFVWMYSGLSGLRLIENLSDIMAECGRKSLLFILWPVRDRLFMSG